jgi:hypothetical protein
MRYTLVSDGSSDRALLPILTWLLVENGLPDVIEAQWADLRSLPKPPINLNDRIIRTIDLYPCDVLFIHRDAENQPFQRRVDEIEQAVNQIGNHPKSICVVPVRMQEAWLLFDEAAIRTAAGNPNGRTSLNLPPLHTVENIANPKNMLHELLRAASGFKGRRLKNFKVRQAAINVAQYTRNFAPLRRLSAFQLLESDVQKLIEEYER